MTRRARCPGATVGLIDRNDTHHHALRGLFEDPRDRWVLPWAILEEVDYLVGAHVGVRAQDAFLADLAEGAFDVHWGHEADLHAAHQLARTRRRRIQSIHPCRCSSAGK